MQAHPHPRSRRRRGPNRRLKLTEIETPVFCPYCPNRIFKHVDAVREHFRRLHNKTDCRICHVDFGHAHALIDHAQLHYRTESPAENVVSSDYTPSVNSQASRASQSSRVNHANEANHASQVGKSSQINDTRQVNDASQAIQLPSQQLPIQFIQLEPQEQDVVLHELLTRCHSPIRLRLQDYTMPASPIAPARNASLSETCTAKDESPNTVKVTGRRRFNQTSPPTQPRSFNKARSFNRATPPTQPRNFSQPTSFNKASRPTQPRKRHALPPELFKPTPQRPTTGAHDKRKAVALDCEMVELTTCHSELAYLSAIDFLTSEVLIDSFVAPTGTVVCWRTKFSGIDADNMGEAVRNGKALRGWYAARDKLWEFIDDQTVLVGHALQNDLQVLGIFHPRIVDSSILTAEAVFNTLQPDVKFPRVWGLKKLAKVLLGQDIQTSDKGHSALEDAYAARSIVLCAIQTPQELAQWGRVVRKVEERLVQESELAKRKKQEALWKHAEDRARQKQTRPAASAPPPTDPVYAPAYSTYTPAYPTYVPAYPTCAPSYPIYTPSHPIYGPLHLLQPMTVDRACYRAYPYFG